MYRKLIKIIWNYMWQE